MHNRRGSVPNEIKDAPKLPVSTRLKTAAKAIITTKYSTNLKEATSLCGKVDAASSLATLIPVVSNIVLPLIATAVKTDVPVKTFRTVYAEATVAQQKKDETLKGLGADKLALEAKATEQKTALDEAAKANATLQAELEKARKAAEDKLALQAQVAEQKTALETAAKANASLQTELENARKALESEKTAAKERETKALQEATNKQKEAELSARSAALEIDTLKKEVAVVKIDLSDMTAKRELSIVAKDQAVAKLADETEKNRRTEEKSKAQEELMQSRLETAKENLTRKENEAAALSAELLKAHQAIARLSLNAQPAAPQTPVVSAVLKEQKTNAPATTRGQGTAFPRQTGFPPAAPNTQFFDAASQSAAPPGKKAAPNPYTEIYFQTMFKNLFNANAINVLEEMRDLISQADPKNRVYVEAMQEYRFKFICFYINQNTNEELRQELSSLEEKMKASKMPLEESSLSACANDLRTANIERFPQGPYGIAKLLNQAYAFSKNSTLTGLAAHRTYFETQMNKLDPKKKAQPKIEENPKKEEPKKPQLAW